VTTSYFDRAAAAVRLEYEHSSRSVELQCQQASDVTEPGRSKTIYRLAVGQVAPFDWTWEGSVASGPAAPPIALPGDEASVTRWTGEVVWVDQDRGHIYVSMSVGRPDVGAFVVKPFEFLACLHQLYEAAANTNTRTSVEHNLSLACGEPPPPPGRPLSIGIEALRESWAYPWAILWGPPGTGKTTTIGKQVARLHVDAPNRRMLVVSTTNKATDAAAVSIARGLREFQPQASIRERVVRGGSGANFEELEKAGCLDLLYPATDHDVQLRRAELQRQISVAATAEEKARLGAELNGLDSLKQNRSSRAIDSDVCRVLVTTAFDAVAQLRNKPDLEPFDMVIIDEASLVSRAAVAIIALLGKQTVIVGDPKQLAPISQMCRIMLPEQGLWLAESSLGHLEARTLATNVHLLTEQHRMHPHIRAVVSNYQYDGKLVDGAEIAARPCPEGVGLAAPRGGVLGVFNELLPGVAAPPADSRAVWYVLDEEADSLAQLRAERGPGGRSWVRPLSTNVLRKLFDAFPGMRGASGLFLSPFAAQARAVHPWFLKQGLSGWTASTIHRQQGGEADVVVFDTVNASSTAWPFDEWKRLVNVGVSRARELLIVLASRDEMQQPQLAELNGHLQARVVFRNSWKDAEAQVVSEAVKVATEQPWTLGGQFMRRQQMRPIMSAEQQQLCGLKLDGGARLVRGVAGSGKTLVLANWLARTMHEKEVKTAMVVYANAALRHLLEDSIRSAWKKLTGAAGLPKGATLLHIADVLGQLGMRVRDYDYDRAATDYLAETRRADRIPQALCDSLFVDEAQDFGPGALELLACLVRPSPTEPGHKRVLIFYDNAQNVYSRRRPTWKDLGVDVQGRSTVMKESFRSTQPISELALNVLYRLSPPAADEDHIELKNRRLIERASARGREWWRVRFNHAEGPAPTFKVFSGRNAELKYLIDQVDDWLTKEAVLPRDLCFVCNGKREQDQIARALRANERKWNCHVHEVRGGAVQPFGKVERDLVVITTHSFKGYDAEIVVVPAVERFVGQDAGAKTKAKILSNVLYVAMTRARSVLVVTGTRASSSAESTRILETIGQACDDLAEVKAGRVEARTARPCPGMDALVALLAEHHEPWLRKLAARYSLVQDVLADADGEVLAEPLFWFDASGARYACFSEAPSVRVKSRLDDARVSVVRAGDSIPGLGGDPIGTGLSEVGERGVPAKATSAQSEVQSEAVDRARRAQPAPPARLPKKAGGVDTDPGAKSGSVAQRKLELAAELAELEPSLRSPTCSKCDGRAELAFDEKGLFVRCKKANCRHERLLPAPLQLRLAERIHLTCHACEGVRFDAVGKPFGAVLVCKNAGCGVNLTWRGIRDRRER